MKFIISLLLSLFAVSFCFSQSNRDDGKWEVGLNVLPLFDSSFYVVQSINTGYHVTETLSSYILIRRSFSNTLKLRGSLGFRFEDSGNRPVDRPESSLVANSVLGTSFSLGAEKYIKTGNLSVYLGGGFSGYYLRSIYKNEEDTRPNAIPPTIYKIRDFYSDRQYGAEALAGINARVISNLYLSIESSFLFGFRKAKYDYKQHEGEMLLLTAYGGGTRKRYIADLRPISAVQIIYQF